MTALAADFQRSKKLHTLQLLALPVKDDAIIYQGAMVNVDAAGLAVAGSNTAAQKFAGIAHRGLDNTNGGNGTITGAPATGGVRICEVDTQGPYSLTYTGTAPIARDTAYLVDDNTVQVAATSQAIKVGIFTEPDLLTPGNWFVDIEPAKIPA